ncbi:MAG: AhpC/TSA family protein [Bacteroidia bacterium]
MKNFILFCFLLFTQWLNAQDFEKNGMDTTYIPIGLKVGSLAPDISLPTVNGDFFSLADAIQHKKVVLVFYRGQWCPYCSRHLSNLNDSLNLINEKNAIVVAIGPETVNNAEKMLDKSGNGLLIIADEEMKTLTDYDVLFTVTENYQKKIKRFLVTDIGKNNGQKEAKLPVPATYVINQDGTIVYRHFEYNYRTRSTIKDIIGEL